MDAVTVFLLAIAAVFLIGTVGEILFQKTSVPDVIWLLLAGIVIGPVCNFVTREQLSRIAPFFAAVALVIALFEGGMSLKLSEMREAAPRSGVLGVLGFVQSVLAAACATMVAAWLGWLPASWSWTHGLLVGCILGGTSSVVMLPALAKAELPGPIASLVKLESAITEALCVLGTAALVDLMTNGAAHRDGPALALLRTFGIGLGIGLAAGFAWLLLLRFLKNSEHAYSITLTAVLLLYVLIGALGGSAAVGILVVAIILGNAEKLSASLGMAEQAALQGHVRVYHRQMAFMIKSFFFVFIGAMIGPPWPAAALGALLGVGLLGTRAPIVYLATMGGRLQEEERTLMLIAFPRGLAAGVLATWPVTAGVADTADVPVLVFSCILTTTAIFSVGFPILKGEMVAARKPLVPAAPAKKPAPEKARPTPPTAATPTAAPTAAPAIAPSSATASAEPAATAGQNAPAPDTSAPDTSARDDTASAAAPSVAKSTESDRPEQTLPPPLPDLDLPGLEAIDTRRKRDSS